MDQQIKKLFRDEIAAEGAKRFGLRSEELSFIGGFQNFIYSYRREGCKYILRFTPSTLRTPEGLEAELEWIRYLAENGMSVSEPIPSAQGIDVETVPGETSIFTRPPSSTRRAAKSVTQNVSVIPGFMSNAAV